MASHNCVGFTHPASGKTAREQQPFGEFFDIISAQMIGSMPRDLTIESFPCGHFLARTMPLPWNLHRAMSVVMSAGRTIGASERSDRTPAKDIILNPHAVWPIIVLSFRPEKQCDK